jgi:uncharacterized membrane protein YphA (DoxX/SURF4 family)
MLRVVADRAAVPRRERVLPRRHQGAQLDAQLVGVVRRGRLASQDASHGLQCGAEDGVRRRLPHDRGRRQPPRRPLHSEQFFASLDIPAPGLTAPFVAVTETVGGVLLIVGLATPLVGLALAGDMLVALLTAHVDQGFFVDEGGFEPVLLLGGASLAIAFTGAGRFSVDAALGVTRRLWQRVSPEAGNAVPGTRS